MTSREIALAETALLAKKSAPAFELESSPEDIAHARRFQGASVEKKLAAGWRKRVSRFDVKVRVGSKLVVWGTSPCEWTVVKQFKWQGRVYVKLQTPGDPNTWNWEAAKMWESIETGGMTVTNY